MSCRTILYKLTCGLKSLRSRKLTMQNPIGNFSKLQWPANWCHYVLLCLLLLTFSASTYSASTNNTDKQLSAQKATDAAFIVTLSSSVSESQADEPELDKTIAISSDSVQGLPTVALPFFRKTHSFISKWNWHLVRGPPTHL